MLRPKIAVFLFLLVCNSLDTRACCLPWIGHRHTNAYFLADQESAFQRGLVALKKDLPELALRELTLAENERPEDARVRSFRGIALTRLGRTTEAANEYREATRLDPSMEDAYRNLGFLEWKEQQQARALVDLQHAVELSPNDSFARYYLGRVQLDAQNYNEAFKQLKLSAMPGPSDPGFLIAVANGYLKLGRQQELRQTLDRLSRLPLSDAESVRLASILLETHENDQAIGLLKNISNRDGSRAPSWIHFDLALAHLLAGSYQNAVEQALLCTVRMRASVEEPAVAASAWSLLGIAYAHVGDSNSSVAALRQATSISPAVEEHWLNLTRELMALDRYEEAISATRQGLAANPTSYALHLRLGAANLAANHYPEAENDFRQLIAAGDPLPTSYVGLAQVLLRLGRADEAAAELEDASRRLGQNFLLDYFRGLALFRTATPERAVAAFEDALRSDPESAEAHLGLGKTELALGHAQKAVTELEETLRLNPGNPQARHLLMQARRRAGGAQPSEVIADPTPTAEGNLLGDLVLPQWILPQETTAH